jgi:transposase
LDIGKNVHWLGAYVGFNLKPVIEPLEVRSDRTGFQQVTTIVDALLDSKAYAQVVLGHEPSGVYHEAWARALYERYVSARPAEAQPPLYYRYLNPLLSKRARGQLNQGRLRKTDRIDLMAIARCLRDGDGQPAYLPTLQALRFQRWGQSYRQLVRQRLRLTVALLSQLDRLWPGAVVNVRRFRQMHPQLEVPVPLVLSKPLQRQRVQAILSHCPDPHQFLALGQDGIQAFFRAHLGRCGPATAKLAYQVVANALLPPPDIAALLAQDLQADFQHYLALEQRLEQVQQQVHSLLPGSPAEVLTTIPGVSPFLAARYLAYLGHPQRFDQASQIWAFAGFDPVTTESGDYRRIGHISCKGRPGLRDTLFLIGLHTAHHIPAFATTKQRALARGKGHVAATIHVAHKANRLCHHLLYQQCPFDPAKVR